VALQAGQFNGAHVAATIAQEGTIPTDAQSIRMKIVPFLSGSTPLVTIGSQSIPMFVLSLDSNGILLGGGVSSYAGSLKELRISSPSLADHPYSIFGSFVLDNIAFSSQPIPEPTTTGLLVTGLIALVYARARVRSQCANEAPAPNRRPRFPFDGL
jgi:hypothetical protein